MRRFAVAAVALALLLALGWQLLPSLLLRLPGLLAPRVGPPREVVWEAGPPAPAARPGERPPNVVLIVADDLGWNDLSFRGGGLGGGRVATPRIDSIAREGVSFTTGYAANATCAPSRAALLTGRYPTRSGYEFTPAGVPLMRGVALFNRRERPPPIYHEEVEEGYPAREEQGLPPSEITLAELLRERGYRTLHLGKWHLGEAEAFRPDEAVKAIEANRHRPFLLYLAFNAPHTPLQALRSDYEALAGIESHAERVYGAMLRSLDRAVGRVLDALERSGLEEDTLVIFTSDNGGANYVGLPELNRPFRGWKMTFFEGGVHLPLLLKWPRALPRGAEYAAPVAHFDLFATAAAAAGAPLPADRVIDGVDLVPFATGRARGRPHETLFWRSGHYRAVRAGDWKLQVAERPRRAWLFDLASDPTERENRADAEPARVAALRALLDAHDAEQSPPLWPSLLEGAIRIDPPLGAPAGPDDEYVYWPN